TSASLVLQPRFCFCWRADILRFRSYRPVPKRGGLCRSHPQGREASQSAGGGGEQVPTGNQSKDSESARPLRTALAARPCRRGHRVRLRCPLMALSGYFNLGPECPLLGVKRTWRLQCEMSAFDAVDGASSA